MHFSNYLFRVFSPFLVLWLLPSCTGEIPEQELPAESAVKQATASGCFSSSLGQRLSEGSCIRVGYEAFNQGQCHWQICDDRAWRLALPGDCSEDPSTHFKIEKNHDSNLTCTNEPPEALAPIDGFGYPVGDKTTYPAGGFRVQQRMGHYHTGFKGVHLAQDLHFDADTGRISDNGVRTVNQSVYSVGQGIVRFAGSNRSSYKNVVLVQHNLGDVNEDGKDDFVCSFYGHIHRLKVRTGDVIERGTKIAEILDWNAISPGAGSGNTHLHYTFLSHELCDASARAGGALICGYDAGGEQVGAAIDRSKKHDPTHEPFEYHTKNDIKCRSHLNSSYVHYSPTKLIEAFHFDAEEESTERGTGWPAGSLRNPKSITALPYRDTVAAGAPLSRRIHSSDCSDQRELLGAEVVYTLDIEEPTAIDIRVGGISSSQGIHVQLFDELSLRGSQANACRLQNANHIEAELAPGRYYVTVDSASGNEVGTRGFQLDVVALGSIIIDPDPVDPRCEGQETAAFCEGKTAVTCIEGQVVEEQLCSNACSQGMCGCSSRCLGKDIPGGTCVSIKRYAWCGSSAGQVHTERCTEDGGWECADPEECATILSSPNC